MRTPHRLLTWATAALAIGALAIAMPAAADPWKDESGHHRHHKHKHKHHHHGYYYHPPPPPVVYYEHPRVYAPPPVYYAPPPPGVSLNLSVPLR
jgi:hypothetical protein